MQVRSVMLPNPLALPPETGVIEFIHRVLGTNQTTAVVVDAGGRLLGVVSVHDIFRKMVPHYLNMDAPLAGVIHEGYFAERFRDMESMTVRDLMETDIDTLRPHDTLMKAVILFVRRQRKTIPVVEGDRFVGIVTRRSVLRKVAPPPGGGQPC